MLAFLSILKHNENYIAVIKGTKTKLNKTKWKTNKRYLIQFCGDHSRSTV